MAPRKRSAVRSQDAAPTEETPSASQVSPPRRRGARLLALITRPAAYLPLLVLAGVLGGYILGAIRLHAREREWDKARAELESSLQDARTQEAYYRILVSASRVVVDLYDRNFGLAADELGKMRASMAQTSIEGSAELSDRLEAFQTDLAALARQVEELSRSARETMREIERDLTTALFAEEP